MGPNFKRILPHIYLLHFERQYDLAMHFLRFQEYYESPKFRHQFFTLLDYMEWYSHKHGKGAFTYPTDWTGFNVPSRCLLPFLTAQRFAPYEEQRNPAFPDFNRYDETMLQLIAEAWDEEQGRPFYFIGIFGDKEGTCKDGSTGVIYHELAHAFYATRRNYKKAAKKLLAEMNPSTLAQCREVLSDKGYRRSAIDDEIHAYGATGPCAELKEIFTISDQRPFKKLFEKTLTRLLQKHKE